MKRKIYMLFAIMMISLSACDSYLDVTPSDQQTAGQLFATKSGYYTALNGIYDGLADNTLYGKQMTWELMDIISKRYVAPKGNSAYQDLGANNFNSASVTPMFSSIWGKAYELILASNILMEQIDNRPSALMSDSEADMMKGELYAIRAFLHLDMLRLFGSDMVIKPAALAIPYNESAQVKALDLLPANEVIVKIIRDLDEAERLLAATDPVIEKGPLASAGEENENVQLRYRQYRFNYYTVIALKARAYVWANDKTNALIQAKRLIEDETAQAHFPAVDPNKLLANASNPDRVFSSEVFTGIYKKDRDNIFTEHLSASAPKYQLLQPYNGYVIGSLFTIPLANVTETTTDYRFQSQWEASAAAGSQGHVLCKYKAIDQPDPTDEDSEYFYAKMIPLVRMQEMYHIAAECETELGEQIKWFDAARARRGCSSNMMVSMYWGYGYAPIFLSNEIMREYYGEGQAYYFLKRTEPMAGAYPIGSITRFDNGAQQGDAMIASPALPEGEMK